MANLGEFLVNLNIINDENVEAALKEQKRTGVRFGEALVSLGIVRQEDIDWALSNLLDLPYVRINTETIDPAAVRLVPASVARRYSLIPLVHNEGDLTIAIVDPLNKEGIAEVESVSGCSVSVSMGLVREIKEMQDHFYGVPSEEDFIGFTSSCLIQETADEINADITGVRLLEHLCSYTIDEGLSSLSFKPSKDHITLSGRRGDESRFIGRLSISRYGDFISTLSDRAGINMAGGIPGHGSLWVSAGGSNSRLDVFVLQTGPWVHVTLKPAVSSLFPGTIFELETSESHKETLRSMSSSRSGMVFFSSRSQSERLRLIGSCLRECSGHGKDVITLGRGFWFYNGVKANAGEGNDLGLWIEAASQHEPDVIAVGDIQDTHSFSAAFDCVLGDRLIFTGLPAQDMRAALTQISYLSRRFPMLPWYIIGAAACSGVRMLCPECKEQAHPHRVPVKYPKGTEPEVFFKANGCPACHNTGYLNKRYLVEAVMFDDTVANLLGRSAPAGEIMDYR